MFTKAKVSTEKISKVNKCLFISVQQQNNNNNIVTACLNETSMLVSTTSSGEPSALIILLAVLAFVGFVLSLVFAVSTLMLTLRQRRIKEDADEISVKQQQQQTNGGPRQKSSNGGLGSNGTAPVRFSAPASFHATLSRHGGVTSEISWRDCGLPTNHYNRRTPRVSGGYGGGADENHQAVGGGGANAGFDHHQVLLCGRELANGRCGGDAEDFSPIRKRQEKEDG